MKGPVGLLLAWRDRQFARYMTAVASLIRREDLLFKPSLMTNPEGGRCLVLSPHCDDEVIGMGGLLHHHARAGDPVTVLYFTGGASDPSGARAAEARRAAGILGVRDLVFLDGEESRLERSPDLISQLTEMLDKTEPDIVYLPWFMDNHLDHLAVNTLFARACDQWKGDCLVSSYEVWSPLMPNRLFDITPYAGVKREALAAFESQLDQVDYLETTLALNRYRSTTHLAGRGYAEAYLCLDLTAYRRLFAEWSGEDRLPLYCRKSVWP